MCALLKRLALETDEYLSDNDCSVGSGAAGTHRRGGGGGGGGVGGSSLRAARKRRRQQQKERASSNSKNYELDGINYAL